MKTLIKLTVILLVVVSCQSCVDHTEDVTLKTAAASVEYFQISVYAPGERGPVLTSGNAYIMKEGRIIRTYRLEAQVNKIPFDLDRSVIYDLVIEKTAYAKQGVKISYDQLQRPLVFHVVPALTMLAVPAADNQNSFTFHLQCGNNSSIVVNWGDGTSQAYTSNGAIKTFTKNYATSGERYVTVTGSIGSITRFSFQPGFSQTIIQIDFHALSNLTNLTMQQGPAIIDLTSNTHLQRIKADNYGALQQLLLPSYHDIEFIDISGVNSMNTAAVDQIIGNIYYAAAGLGNETGDFWLLDNIPDNGQTMVGPPSAIAMQQLHFIRDVKNWDVFPFF